MEEKVVLIRKVSLLERCPHFVGVLREEFHCIPTYSRVKPYTIVYTTKTMTRMLCNVAGIL